MRNFMEAYMAVHNQDLRDELNYSRDSISEMNLAQLTDTDLIEIVEEVLESVFSEGYSVLECIEIAETFLIPSDNTGRQRKIDRLTEAFVKVFERIDEKASRTAVESYSAYRKGKSLQDSWTNKFSHDRGNVRLHNSLVAEDREFVKSALLGLYEKKGDGNLANNYPPYDKVTRGDIIAGATGKDQMGGKKKKVKESFGDTNLGKYIKAGAKRQDAVAALKDRLDAYSRERLAAIRERDKNKKVQEGVKFSEEELRAIQEKVDSWED